MIKTIIPKVESMQRWLLRIIALPQKADTQKCDTACLCKERYLISWPCRVLTIFPDVLFDRFFWLIQLSSEDQLDSKDTASCFCLPYSHTPIPYWLVNNIYDIKFAKPWQFISIYWPSLDLGLKDSHNRNLVTSKKVLLEKNFLFFGLPNNLEIMSVYIENFTFF